MQFFPFFSCKFHFYFLSLPSRNIIERFAPGAVKDARVMTQGIFYVHTSETCQRSHYTNSGGHPVDISPRTKSIMFRDREGCRFLCLIGEGAPRCEAGGNKREVRKDPHPKACPPSSPGESVPAVRRNRKNDLEVSDSVGALPFFEESKPRRADPCTAKHNSNMQQTIQLGQVQPSVLSTVESAVKILKAWWDTRCASMTALCATEEGEVFTHGDVVKAYLYLAALFILIGIGGAL